MRAETQAAEDEDFFEMANLSPTLTGLPMVVWISEGGQSRHDARLKVSLVHGRKAHSYETCSVSIRPSLEVVAEPRPPPDDLKLVRRWVELNRNVVLAYWNGDLLTDEAITRLRPLLP